jgi:phosphate-selective porin OprO/OprP
LKAFLLLLLLAATLGGASAQALDEPELAGQDGLATTEQGPDEVTQGAENATDEASDAVDSDSSEESGPESKIEEKPPLEWKFYWHEGLHYWVQRNPLLQDELHIPDRLRVKPKLEGKVGGLLQVDAALFAGDDELDGFSNDVQLRRLRLKTKGNFFLWVPVYFSLQFDITKDSFYLNDFYLQFRNIPLIQTFTLGHLNAPFSLERLESSRDTTFMERASPVDAFSPGYKPGIEGSGNQFGDRMSWALGWFADGQEADIGDITDSNFRIVGRVTGLPIVMKDLCNNRLLHLGVSYSYVNAEGNSVQYRSRPECYIAAFVVDTGEIPANNANLLGAEVAFVMNSLSFQGEYIHSLVNSDEEGTLEFDGFYAYVSYFPTGETRLYDKSQGIFTRVRPKKNFSLRNHTYGGFELEARYSRLDLNDGDVHGGKMNIFTAGATWYLFPIFKLKFNYGNADIDNREGSDRVHIFQTRVEVDL